MKVPKFLYEPQESCWSVSFFFTSIFQLAGLRSLARQIPAPQKKLSTGTYRFRFQPRLGKREDPGDKVTAVPLFAQRWTQLIDAHFFMRGNLKLPETAKKHLKEVNIFSVLWWFPRVLWPLEALIHCLDMSLDVTACLKALSSAFCQYRSHTTEQNTKDLERQIDVSGFWYKLFVINSLNFWIRWTYRKKPFQKSVEYVILSRDVFRVIMVVISDNNNSMSIKQITCELVNSKGRGLHVSKFSHCLPECLN